MRNRCLPETCHLRLCGSLGSPPADRGGLRVTSCIVSSQGVHQTQLLPHVLSQETDSPTPNQTEPRWFCLGSCPETGSLLVLPWGVKAHLCVS